MVVSAGLVRSRPAEFAGSGHSRSSAPDRILRTKRQLGKNLTRTTRSPLQSTEFIASIT